MEKHEHKHIRLCLALGLINTVSLTHADHENVLAVFSEEGSINQLANHQDCPEVIEEPADEPLCNEGSSEFIGFQTPPILSISTQLDIRPDSCDSFFDDYLHTRRGIRIESALESASPFNLYAETVSTFPIIDFVDNRDAHVTKSKDLSVNAYNNESENNSLYESIVADAKDIQNRFFSTLLDEQVLSAKANGESTTIRAGEIDSVTLHIVVQAGIATPNQVDQIKLAAMELENRWGYTLKVIEIP